MLHAPLDFNVAYPVNDLTLRYLEEQQRLLIYQISHREQSLANLDYDFQQLLSIIGAMCPNFLKQAKKITTDALARQWAFVRDDLAVATEMMATTIHQRRQGMLCFGTDQLTLQQRLTVLSRPYLGETRIIQLDDRGLTHAASASSRPAGTAADDDSAKTQTENDEKQPAAAATATGGATA